MSKDPGFGYDTITTLRLLTIFKQALIFDFSLSPVNYVTGPGPAHETCPTPPTLPFANRITLHYDFSHTYHNNVRETDTTAASEF